jgi:hypothetical protein
MYRFWGRELMGWLLIAIGLGIFYLVIALLLSPGAEFILEGPPVAMIGIFVFRGGIHLLKVAVAARVCMQVQTEGRAPVAVAPKNKKTTDLPWDW